MPIMKEDHAMAGLRKKKNGLICKMILADPDVLTALTDEELEELRADIAATLKIQ